MNRRPPISRLEQPCASSPRTSLLPCGERALGQGAALDLDGRLLPGPGLVVAALRQVVQRDAGPVLLRGVQRDARLVGEDPQHAQVSRLQVDVTAVQAEAADRPALEAHRHPDPPLVAAHQVAGPDRRQLASYERRQDVGLPHPPARVGDHRPGPALLSWPSASASTVQSGHPRGGRRRGPPAAGGRAGPRPDGPATARSSPSPGPRCADAPRRAASRSLPRRARACREPCASTGSSSTSRCDASHSACQRVAKWLVGLREAGAARP